MNKEQLRKLIKEELKAVLNEDGHTDVSSARRQAKLAIEDSQDILQHLEGFSPEQDLPSWWMKKVSLASAYLNSARDYLLTSGEPMNEMEIRSMDAGEQRRKCARLKDSHDTASYGVLTDETGYDVIEMQKIEKIAAKFDCDWVKRRSP